MKKRLRTNSRIDTIVNLINEHGFLSVKDLSQLCQVSEITIRRDLITLDQQKRIQRTHGGGASLRGKKVPLATSLAALNHNGLERPLLDRIDALIATVVDIQRDKAVLDQFIRSKIPIVAEALPALNEVTVVTVDNYMAGLELGRWIGRYIAEHWHQQAHVLDLTYHLPNTQARSRGFMTGLREVIPDADEVLSLNTESRYDLAYQLTRDALSARSNINLIFAINDTNASAAIQACRDLRVDPAQVKVIPFGLEGDTLRNELSTCPYCLAGLAMFPEIVGPVCIEAVIEAYNQRPLPPQLLTPYAILTPETLPEYYARTDTGWIPQWQHLKQRAALPIEIDRPERHAGDQLPQRIGFTVRFSGHEWYQNLIAAMQAQVAQLGIELEIIDIDQTMRDEIDLRQREIARRAIEEIKPGDVIMLDDGSIGVHLAEQLAAYQGVTVISNSMPVLEVLKTNPNIIVIATGGAIRHSSQVLVGPTAEATLREMRADKLFLNVSGVSLNFGLSHPNISEVTIKQTMIRSAREVILLADHTCFGHESFIHVASLKSIHKLITDDALPASFRLELSKLGIEVVLARM